MIFTRTGRFRPLAGVNCNLARCCPWRWLVSFRPLAGINCNYIIYVNNKKGICFRPLTEYSFTIPHIESKEKNYTPEKRGWSRKDKS